MPAFCNRSILQQGKTVGNRFCSDFPIQPTTRPLLCLLWAAVDGPCSGVRNTRVVVTVSVVGGHSVFRRKELLWKWGRYGKGEEKIKGEEPALLPHRPGKK